MIGNRLRLVFFNIDYKHHNIAQLYQKLTNSPQQVGEFVKLTKLCFWETPSLISALTH